jgi:uncharacterized protein YbaA (DUF1428 family)
MPKDKVSAYKQIAERACKIWMEHGALEYRECIAEDTNTAFGLSFPVGIQAKEGETVVFAWITYQSREHRDEVNEKVMKDPRIAQEIEEMPFDSKRMLYSGFEVLVSS